MKRRTSLVRLIGKNVRLQKAGAHEYKGLCPFHPDKTPSFSVNDHKGVYLCRSACGESGDAITWAMHAYGDTFHEAVQRLAEEAGLAPRTDGRRNDLAPVVAAYDPAEAAKEAADKVAWARWLWGQCRPLTGSIAERYLAERGITVAMMPEGLWPVTLRFHPECEWMDEDENTGKVRRLWRPALVAAVQGGRVDGLEMPWGDRAITGVHRTYLTPDGAWKAGLLNCRGEKADKKMGGVCACGAVRLGPGGVELDVGEGLESSLTVMAAIQKPVWAALSLNNMSAIEFPAHVQAVNKWTDADESDRLAAQRSIARGNERHTKLGLAVAEVRPPEGHDWNSIYLKHRKAELLNRAERHAREVA